MQMIYDGYRDLMDNKSDPRVNDWSLMSGPFPTLAICLFYAYFVKVLGPKLMENRKPFDLRRVMIWYNLFQVTFSSWLFNEVSCQAYLYSCKRNSSRCFIFFLMFAVSSRGLGRTLLLQVSTDRLLKQSARAAYGTRLLVVLYFKVYRVHGHDLLCVEKKEWSHYHSPCCPSRLHAHVCLVRG